MPRHRRRLCRAPRRNESRYSRPRIEPLEDRRLLAVYVVNTSVDLPDLTPAGDGIVDVDVNTPGEQVTLRGAIMDANSVPDPSTIQFRITGSGPHVIQLLGPLPIIVHPMAIEGYSQPGSARNTGKVREGNNAVIQIELNGSGVPIGYDGLVLTGGQSTVEGLAIHSLRGEPVPAQDELGVVIDHRGGAAIRLAGSGGNHVVDNFLGANADGFSLGNYAGINVECSDNVIQDNLVVGNTIAVGISGDLVTGNQLLANYIGVLRDGLTPAHNIQGVVISRGASQTQIGGSNLDLGNVISANQRSGVSIFGLAPRDAIVGSNVVQNNLIGTDRTGRRIDPDGSPGSGDELGNGDFGVSITASRNNVIGLNVISGNRQSGVVISDENSTLNSISGNWIGTDIEGLSALGNVLHGVEIQNAGNNVVTANTLSGNQSSGVAIFGSEASGNEIKNNQIGTNATGLIAVPNALHGVQIVNAPRNVVDGNLISGNALVGVHISGKDAAGNEIQNNRIGTDRDGIQSLSNEMDGVYIHNAPGNAIGGSTANQRNLISGNKRHGVMVLGGEATGNQVAGNYIGTTRDGVVALPNRGDGVHLDGAPGNIVGGATANHRNLISGNLGRGVAIVGANATKNQIASNYIGVDEYGNGAGVGNKGDGVFIDQASETQVGGSTSQAGDAPGNVISQNSSGVRISGFEAGRNIVQGNLIGRGKDGLVAANSDCGVWIDDASTNVIGDNSPDAAGPAAVPPTANTISGNGKDAVRVSGGGVSNTIRKNRIYANGGLGINLLGREDARRANDGVTPNDTRDTDVGPNELLNFPVGVTAFLYDGTTYISGVLDAPNLDVTVIDVYANASIDASGFGEGQLYVGTVKPNKQGVFHLTISTPLPYPFLSATATDKAVGGSTSEFSPVYGDPDGDGKVDSDGDGFPDEWELGGLDFNGDGVVDLDLPSLLAKPDHKDIFLEIDHIQGYKMSDAALPPVIAAFAKAPVANPDNTPGITLHALLPSSGDAITPTQNRTPMYDWPSVDYDFYDLKRAWFGTSADRGSPNKENTLSAKRLVYRYCLSVQSLTDELNRAASHSGEAELVGNDFAVALVGWGRALNYWGGPIQAQSAVLMHELGHTLGLGHGGTFASVNPNLDGFDRQGNINYKPNYFSIMNYAYSYVEYSKNRPLDYSRIGVDELVILNESDLDEDEGVENGESIAGLGTGAGLWDEVVFTFPGTEPLKPRKASSIGSVDWNQDGIYNAADYALSINEVPGATGASVRNIAEILESREDWNHLIYDFRASRESFTGAGPEANNSLTDPEPTREEMEELARLIDTDDDGISNWDDNAPFVFNPDQHDADSDGTGDAGELLSISLAATSIASGETTLGTISLLAPAPAGGTRVNLISSDYFSARVPSAVLIPVGARFATFTVQATGHGSANTTTQIYADFFGEILSTELVIGPRKTAADLEVTKAVVADPDSVGRLTYTITVTNHGPEPVVGVQLTDVLPNNVSLVSAAASGGFEKVAGPGLTVRFDYTYDTNNFFATQEKRDLLESAARLLIGSLGDDLAAIHPGGDNSWAASFIDPSTGAPASVTDMVIAENELVIFVGARDLGAIVNGFAESGRGGFGGSTASGTTDFLRAVRNRGEIGADDATPSDFARWGGQIAFNTNPDVKFHFGTSTEGLDPDETDFSTVVMHELAHVLGFGRADSWLALVDVPRGLFTGPASRLEFESDVPLDQDQSHWADGTLDGGNATLMDPSNPVGTRIFYPTPLDWAGLNDVGWNTDGMLVRERRLPIVERDGSVAVDVGALDPGDVATVTIEVIVTLPGDVVNRASVTSPYLNDLDPSNNEAIATINIPAPPMIVVNTTDDLDDGVADATHTSLREAINLANLLPGLNTIHFDISGPGPHTIRPTASLPVITDAVIIDGTTEPDYAARPVIELDGTLAGPDASGLYITAGDSRIRGLVINRFGSIESSFTSGNGIVLDGGGNSVIEGCYLGTDVTGTVPAGNERAGIVVVNSTNNLIGGVTVEARNVISGNGHAGVALGYGAEANLVQGNFIGTSVGGDMGISATMVGVEIGGTRSNVIGGTVTGARNVISGNLVGVHLQNSQDNLVQGNYIGTTASGFGELSNFTGVLITGGARNTIGGVDAGNVIGGNQIGISVSGPYDELPPDLYHRILGNWIGTVPDAATSLGNVLYGVLISEGGHAIVGGTEPGEGNSIAYNFDGIWSPSGEVVIRGNSIYFNARSGIFVGPHLNDPGDQHPPLNYPVLALASSDGTSTRIEGEVNTPFYAIPAGGGDPIAVDVVLDFYANASGDSTGHVEGRTYLGSWTITAPTGTDGKPLLTTNMSFVASLPVDVPDDQRITATTFKGHRSSGFSAEIAVVRDTDRDGVPDPVEDAAPSGGDANADGTPDRLQANVASFPNAVNGRYVVLEAAGDATFEKVATVSNPSPLDEPPLVTFPLGYLSFELVVGPTATSGMVRLTSESGTDLDTLYGFGPTPDDSTGHWYAFPFDGSTGAEVFADRIDVHLADSARGDHDLTANGRIRALLAPTIVGAYEGVTFVVNTADDLDDGDLQQLSLREAILQANLHPGRDRVEFNIPPSGSVLVRTIRPASPLPVITDPIIIDGYSQPGAAPATGDGRAVPLIELDGSLLVRSSQSPPHGPIGLHITAGHSLIQGLVINRFVRNNWGDSGIAILLQTVGGNVIQGNWLGTSYDGAFAYDNSYGGYGVVIDGCPDNRVGGVAAAARNLISGFYIGIDIRGEAADRNLAQGNYIGTDVTGAYIPNGHFGWLGIRITNGADENLIGGTVGTTPGGRASGAANVMAGNTYGVFIDGGTLTRNNTLQGNYLGTDGTGKYALGNNYGVSDRGADTVVGGTTAAARNIISGNYKNGIEINSGGAIIQGNFIGTDVSGALPLGNGAEGIWVVDSYGDTLIGGDSPGAGNVISASGGSGILLHGNAHVPSTEVVIQGNFIGTDVTGTVAIGNGAKSDWPLDYRAGIQVSNQDSRVIVGGVSPGAGNLISGNGGDGIRILNNSIEPRVEGNLIGADITGTSPLGNGFAGIHVWSRPFWFQIHNTIGGTDPRAGNTIAFNGTEGVFLEGGERTAILSNAIFANGTLGIDLGPGPGNDYGEGPDGVTPNDAGDADGGVNGRQNFPVLTSARIEGGTTVEGLLDSLPNRTYRLEFFSNQVVNASGHGEGQVFLGSIDVVTDGSGQASFSVTLAMVVPVGHFFTATATSPEGATSEFSQAIAVEVPLDQLDFGDAPAGFPTLLTDEGARHVIVPGLYLGWSVDGDPDGRPSDAADGDDLDSSDDEDGVVFATPLVAGQVAVVDVTASADGRLDAWIDFDGDGNWDAVGDRVFSNMWLLSGRNTLFFTVPPSAVVTNRTYARFRLSSTGGLVPGGLALDGEVEDYALIITAGPAVPVAQTDHATTNQATPVAIDVAANDTDANGNLDVTTVKLLAAPRHGAAFVDRRSGVVTYIPQADFNGMDSFVYQIGDTDGFFDSTVVTVDVLPGNQPPIANDDVIATDEDTPVTIDVLANDADADGSLNPTSVAIRLSPRHGTALLDPSTGAVLFIPDSDFHGSDTFLYEVIDSDGASDWATVTVTIRPVNDPPMAGGDEAVTVESVPVIIDVLANDSDRDENLDPTTVTVIDGPALGSVSIDPVSGAIRYVAPADWAGIATFTYEVSDAGGLSDTAVVAVEVLPLNSPPETRDDAAVTVERQAVTIDVAANDFDRDENLDRRTVQIFVSPLWGAVEVDSASGAITYTPIVGFDQIDMFAYRISDTTGASSVALVAVTVNSINDPPVANDDRAETWRDTPIDLSVLGNDTDIDSAVDPATVRMEAAPANGSVVVQPNGVIRYVPETGFVGTDQFRYTVADDAGARSNIALVTVDVRWKPVILIVGRVFDDLDQKGPELAGPGLAGQTILLLDGQGQLIGTTLTQTDNPATTEDETGWYQFPDLQPGDYIVAQRTIPNWEQSHPSDQGVLLPDIDAYPCVYSVTLSITNNLEVLDFGIYRSEPAGYASISGYVYVDVNNNGVCDPPELRLPNVPITITGPVTRELVTDAEGAYRANDLPAGLYTISETQPQIFRDGRDTPGTPLLGTVENDRFLNVELQPGAQASDYNFGENGLRPEFISKQLYLASTPSGYEFVASLRVENGESLLFFESPASGLLRASAQSEGEPSAIQLYDSQWRPVALATGNGALNVPVTQGDQFILYVETSLPADVAVLWGTAPHVNPVYVHTNPRRSNDVDDDGYVTPRDALLVINRLTAFGNGAVGGVNLGAYYLDVNGDRFVSPIDALRVINYLNGTDSASGEGEWSGDESFAVDTVEDVLLRVRSAESWRGPMDWDVLREIRRESGASPSSQGAEEERLCDADHLWLTGTPTAVLTDLEDLPYRRCATNESGSDHYADFVDLLMESFGAGIPLDLDNTELD